MQPSNVVRTTLHDGGFEAITVVETPVGIYTTTVSRNHAEKPFTEADFPMLQSGALKMSTSGLIAVGERRTARRFVLPGGNHVLFVHLNTGPPTWWRPRFEAFRRPNKRDGRTETVVRGGWLRAALTFAVSRNTRKDQP